MSETMSETLDEIITRLTDNEGITCAIDTDRLIDEISNLPAMYSRVVEQYVELVDRLTRAELSLSFMSVDTEHAIRRESFASSAKKPTEALIKLTVARSSRVREITEVVERLGAVKLILLVRMKALSKKDNALSRMNNAKLAELKQYPGASMDIEDPFTT